MQQQTGEIWGRPVRGGQKPAVRAYSGPLLPGQRGIEFATDILPDPQGAPHRPEWRGPRPGVREENGFAKLTVTITRCTQ